MGDRTVSEFFKSCSEDYLANCLDPGIQGNINEEAALEDHAKAHIIALRKDGDIDSSKARELFDEVDFGLDGVTGNEMLLQEVFGYDWWYSLPEKPNPDYEYLCRIINAVKTALKEQLAEAA